MQHNVLGYRIDAYFPKYQLAIEVDEQGHNDRDIDYEIKRQKAIGKLLGCEFIRINPAKENFNIFVEIGKIRLEFKSNNSKKTKCFTKEQEAEGLLSNLGIKTPLNKTPLLNILF